jgi:hypothetical protein
MSLKNKKVKFEELGLKNYMDAFEFKTAKITIFTRIML